MIAESRPSLPAESLRAPIHAPAVEVAVIIRDPPVDLLESAQGLGMERGVALRSGQDAGLAQFGRNLGAVGLPMPVVGHRRGYCEKREQEQECVLHRFSPNLPQGVLRGRIPSFAAGRARRSPGPAVEGRPAQGCLGRLPGAPRSLEMPTTLTIPLMTMIARPAPVAPLGILPPGMNWMSIVPWPVEAV
jgi:hypothetical protein